MWYSLMDPTLEGNDTDDDRWTAGPPWSAKRCYAASAGGAICVCVIEVQRESVDVSCCVVFVS